MLGDAALVLLRENPPDSSALWSSALGLLLVVVLYSTSTSTTVDGGTTYIHWFGVHIPATTPHPFFDIDDRSIGAVQLLKQAVQSASKYA